MKKIKFHHFRGVEDVAPYKACANKATDKSKFESKTYPMLYPLIFFANLIDIFLEA